MKTTILNILFFCSACMAFAQFSPDTIFYDADWEVTTARENAKYFRVYKQIDKKQFYVEDHYLNGSIQMTGYYSSLDPEIREGNFKYYDEEGRLTAESFFRKNNIDGDHINYFPTGEVRRRETFKKGEFVVAKCYTISGADTAYYPKTQSPSFPGGQSQLQSFVSQSIKYPKEAKEAGVEGRVVIKFTVKVDGSISNITVSKSVHPALDKEALRIVSLMPDFEPGKTEGVPTEMTFTFPLLFQLK